VLVLGVLNLPCAFFNFGQADRWMFFSIWHRQILGLDFFPKQEIGISVFGQHYALMALYKSIKWYCTFLYALPHKIQKLAFHWWKRFCTFWDKKNLVNNGRVYQPRLVSRISEPSTVSWDHLRPSPVFFTVCFAAGGKVPKLPKVNGILQSLKWSLSWCDILAFGIGLVVSCS